MKKKTAISIIAVCTLLLSGCAQNGGTAASTTTTAQTTAETTTTTAEAATTTAAETTTTVTEATTAAVTYPKADISTQTRLFGGYVASDSAIKLYRESDESSDVLREIESGTQLDIYECEAEGWYMTAIAKADGSDEYDVGYVKAENIAEIPASDMNAAEGEPNEYGFYPFPDPPASSISVASLSGTWYGENSVLVIKNGSDLYNGTFLFTDSSGTSEGYIKLEYLLELDDTKTFWFTFYKNDGTFWNAFNASGEIPLNDIYAGQSGEPHFARRAEAYITDIVGVWNEADVLDPKTLTVSEDGTFKLEYKDGGALSGTVKIEYEEHPDGSQTPWFNFYEEDGKIWEGFQRSEELLINDLYAGNNEELHFVRVS